MALATSNMLPLGTKAPNFTLLDPKSGTKKSLQELKSDKATVILFICNHCPYVKHIKEGLVKLAGTYQTKGISFIGINPNDSTQYVADAPKKMILEKYPFPYLVDETQEIAKAYQAACTPDFYIFDKQLHCVYRGQFDDSRPDNKQPVTGKDLRIVLDAILNHEPIPKTQITSMGCSIKWKKK